MNDILLIGGGGFIGSNLSHHLETVLGKTCRILDLSSDKLALKYGQTPRGFERADLAADKDRIAAAIAEADCVLNLAAEVLPKRFVTDPLQVVETNLFDGLFVIDQCVRHKKPLVHFSTCEVYGKSGGSDRPFSEETTDCILGPIANQRWIYANAKQLLDRIIHAHGVNDRLDYVVLRPFNFVGPLMDWLYDGPASGQARVVPSFMASLLFDRPIRLVDGGHSRRSFTFIDDAVAAIALIIAQFGTLNRQIVNIGNPANETSMRALGRLMADLYTGEFGGDWTAGFEEVTGADFYGPGYEDCDRRIPDIRKLEALGWAPSCDLEETARRSMAFFIDRRESLRRPVPA